MPERPFSPPLAALLLVLAACGGGQAPPPMDPGPEERQAWVGEAAPSGLTGEEPLAVMVEPLPRGGDGHAVFVDEMELARRYLQPAPGERILRLHLRGPGRLLQEGGEVILEGGAALRACGPPPVDAPPRARVWWLAVAAGGPAPDPEAPAGRRSFLVHGAAPAEAAPRRWRTGALEVDLAPRRWGEAERLAWLEGRAPEAAAGGGPEEDGDE